MSANVIVIEVNSIMDQEAVSFILRRLSLSNSRVDPVKSFVHSFSLKTHVTLFYVCIVDKASSDP